MPAARAPAIRLTGMTRARASTKSWRLVIPSDRRRLCSLESIAIRAASACPTRSSATSAASPAKAQSAWA